VNIVINGVQHEMRSCSVQDGRPTKIEIEPQTLPAVQLERIAVAVLAGMMQQSEAVANPTKAAEWAIEHARALIAKLEGATL